MFPVVIRLLLCAVTAACASHAAATSVTRGATAACPQIAGSEGWRVITLYSLGISARMPPSYQRMIWDRRSDTASRRVHFWKDTHPATRLTFVRTSPDSVAKWAPAAAENATKCEIQTQAGVVSVTWQRTIQPTGGTTVGPLFTIEAVAVVANGNEAVLVAGWSSDSLESLHQLGVVRTLRMLGHP